MRAVSLMLLSIWLNAAGGLVLSANELTEQQGLLSEACDAGDGEACLELGAVEAIETPKKAITYYRRACVLGFASGCRLLGEAYVSGTGVTRDHTKGRTLLRQACDVADVDACFSLASVPGVRDRLELLERACGAQIAEACYRLGSHYSDNPLSAGMPAIYEKATSYFQEACDTGHQQGCEALRRSRPAAKTYERLQSARMKRLLNDCSQDDISACGELAMAFSTGSGVEKNAEIAFRLHRRVCDAGELKSCVSLGLAYLEGAGTEPDSTLGIGLLAETCDAGEADACYWLGLSYDKGFGVERNDSKARAMFQKACDIGDVLTCRSTRSYMKLMDERQ